MSWILECLNVSEKGWRKNGSCSTGVLKEGNIEFEMWVDE